MEEEGGIKPSFSFFKRLFREFCMAKNFDSVVPETSNERFNL